MDSNNVLLEDSLGNKLFPITKASNILGLSLDKIKIEGKEENSINLSEVINNITIKNEQNDKIIQNLIENEELNKNLILLNKDLNTIREPGFYYIKADLENNPKKKNGFLRILSIPEDSAEYKYIQLFSSLTEPTIISFRMGDKTSWGDWQSESLIEVLIEDIDLINKNIREIKTKKQDKVLKDSKTGKEYSLLVENGELFLEEVK